MASASASAPPMTVAYRIVREPEWAAAKEKGSYAGNDLDLRDGYLHMSPASEVRGTLEKYFAGGADDVCVLIVALSSLENVKVEWVAPRSAWFPHLYSQPLPIGAVTEARRVPRRADGTFELPPELQ